MVDVATAVAAGVEENRYEVWSPPVTVRKALGHGTMSYVARPIP
jgi:hypothetical protein